jgi:hypothetical protein
MIIVTLSHGLSKHYVTHLLKALRHASLRLVNMHVCLQRKSSEEQREKQKREKLVFGQRLR